MSLRGKDHHVKAFLSHAYVDREIAGQLRKKLLNFRIDVFVAHDDIEGGEEWMNMLINEIKDCNLFLVLLTKDFHTANFTEQEVGAAVAFGKPIVPISLEKTEGRGFVTKYQYSKMSSELQDSECYKLAHTIYKKVAANPKEAVSLIIQTFEHATSFDQANSLARLLEEYQDFDGKQVRAMAGAFLKNGEIRGGFAAKRVVRKILREHQNLLDYELRNQVASWID